MIEWVNLSEHGWVNLAERYSLLSAAAQKKMYLLMELVFVLHGETEKPLLGSMWITKLFFLKSTVQGNFKLNNGIVSES